MTRYLLGTVDLAVVVNISLQWVDHWENYTNSLMVEVCIRDADPRTVWSVR